MKTALKDEYGYSMTYEELDEFCNYFGILKCRSTAILLMYSTVRTAAIYYCFFKLGIVPILVDPHTDDHALKNIYSIYRPKYIWGQEEQLKRIGEWRSFNIIDRSERYILIETDFDTYSISSDLAILLSTSGSTGSSKFVRISYNNIQHGITKFADRVEISENDIFATVLPLSYCFGNNVLLCAWKRKASVILTDRSSLDPEFSNIIRKERVTVLYIVPYNIKLLEANGLYRENGLGLKKIVISGAGIDIASRTKLCDLSKQTGMKIFYGYGQTEGTTCLTMMEITDFPRKCDSIGQVIDGTAALILDPDEKKEGELVLTGNAVSMGYAEKKDDLAKEDENKGVLYSGDIACIDRDGFVFLKGRKKRIIKVLGKRISLDEIERILMKRFFPVEFACVGNDDDLCLVNTSSEINSEVRDYIVSEVGVPNKFIHMVTVDKLPRMDTGKVNYMKLTTKMMNYGQSSEMRNGMP